MRPAETALEQVTTQIQARLLNAVREGLLLPAWLTEAFGARPRPASDQQQWLNTAAAVIAYRILFDVTDLLTALGPSANTTAQEQRRVELLVELRKINRAG